MGLGSGRRAMKSPPLLIAVLLACVFVLGINYWITSTRCVELQSRVMELEGRIRRAAAERGAVEMKKNEFEDMLSKQKRQIDTIQSLHDSQMQNVQLSCKKEKENLLNNVTTKDGLILMLQDEIANFQKQLEESRLELKELQESQAKKSTYELAQCSNKIAEMNERCEENIRRLSAKGANAEDERKATIITKLDKIKPVTSKQDIKQNTIDIKEDQKHRGVISTAEKPSEDSNKEDAAPLENKEQTKKANVVDEKKPSTLPQEPKVQEKKDENEEEARNEVNPNLANAEEDDDEPKVEDLEEPNKEAENEEVDRENLINMDSQTDDEKVVKNVQRGEEKLNDYNGDEANEAESETEKQVELRAKDQGIKGVNEFAVNKQPEEDEDGRLK